MWERRAWVPRLRHGYSSTLLEGRPSTQNSLHPPAVEEFDAASRALCTLHLQPAAELARKPAHQADPGRSGGGFGHIESRTLVLHAQSECILAVRVPRLCQANLDGGFAFTVHAMLGSIGKKLVENQSERHGSIIGQFFRHALRDCNADFGVERLACAGTHAFKKIF